MVVWYIVRCVGEALGEAKMRNFQTPTDDAARPIRSKGNFRNLLERFWVCIISNRNNN